uniref:ANK_REP_REGION domain-containing protein n=1 Tax=Wuchereria bancrofti TaxID=6293 RepID=A0A1I8ER22_WUCBA
MDHSDLVAELGEIEKMTPAERIALARERRRIQLRNWDEREKQMTPTLPRRQRLKFSPEVALLEATSRGDAVEDCFWRVQIQIRITKMCAIDNNEQILQLLLRHGADVNAQDTEQWTPLHAAACCAYIDIVRLLIDNGANLLAVNADGNMPYDICDDEATLDVIESEMASRGITQAYIDDQRGAAEKQMLDEMKLLRQEGHPLDVRQPDGSTYLHIAAANGYYDVAAFLLRCGVSPSVRDNDLWMPVHAAACWAQPDLIELLCEYGGDINAKTNNGETALDLCEDTTTRAVIVTVQQQEARKKRLAFGVRDSRRQSRKRKKFESPQQPTANTDNPFSARGAIRRLSLRDRSGMTLARMEAQKEQTDLLRSWSKEDVSFGMDDTNSANNSATSGQSGIESTNHAAGQFEIRRRDSPNKKVIKPSSQKTKPMSPDEWLRKLDKENGCIEDDDETSLQLQRGGRTRSSQKKKKKANSGATEVAVLQNGGGSGSDLLSSTISTHGMRRSDFPDVIRRHQKKTCCCTIT